MTKIKKNVIPENQELNPEKNLLTTFACDFPEDENDAQFRQEVEFSRTDYKSKIEAFRTTLGNQDSDFKSKGLIAANFKASELKAMIDENAQDITFIRFYKGINQDGNHFLFAAPIDSHFKQIKRENTSYTEQCCGYPPHTGNFQGDDLLGT